MQKYMASSSFPAALAKIPSLETVFINEIHGDVAFSLIEALRKLPNFQTLYVGVGEKDLKHATDLGCKISPYSSDTSSSAKNVNTSLRHAIAVQSWSVKHELVVLNPGLDLASPLPDVQGRDGMTANLRSFRAKMSNVSKESVASGGHTLGNFIRGMALERLELAGSIYEENDALLPLDSVIKDAHWKSLRHCTFTGATFSSTALLRFLTCHKSLEQISFRMVALTEGTWVAVFSHLAKVEKSQLKRLDLGDELRADGITQYKRDPDNAAFAEGVDTDIQMDESFRRSLEVLRKVTGMSDTCITPRYISYSTKKMNPKLPIDLITAHLV